MRKRRFYPPNEGIEWVKSILIAFVIAFMIKNFIFNSTYVIGNSMEPTLYPKDRLFAQKISLYLKSASRGDIVVLRAPDDPSKDYIKRIIGIEGDRVEIRDGRVYLNGELLVEDYIDQDAYTHTYGREEWVVASGEVFVLGDNRAEGASKDSRIFGSVSLDSLKGVTGFRYYPFNDRFGKLN